MADPVGLVGLIPMAIELTNWIIAKSRGFRESDKNYATLVKIKNHHVGCLQADLDILQESKRGRHRAPDKDLTNKHTEELLSTLVDTLQDAADFLYHHKPRTTSDRFRFSFTAEATAKTYLNEVEAAQRNLSEFLHLIELKNEKKESKPKPLENRILQVEEPTAQTGPRRAVAKYHPDSETPAHPIAVWIEQFEYDTVPESLDSLDSFVGMTATSDATGSSYTGVLPYLGFKDKDLLFQCPNEVIPMCTLEKYITDTQSDPPSLDTRFRLARELSRAVLKVHASGLVHRDLRSQNILIFDGRKHEGVEPSQETTLELDADVDVPPPGYEERWKIPELPVKKGSSAKRSRSGKRGDSEKRSRSVKKTVGKWARSLSRNRKEKETKDLPQRRAPDPAATDTVKRHGSTEHDHSLPPGVRTVYLSSWKFLASMGGTAKRLGPTDDLRKNVYHHPTVRNGTIKVTDSFIGTDAYSLGICLLEIGLWKPLDISNGKETPVFLEEPATTNRPEEAQASQSEGRLNDEDRNKLKRALRKYPEDRLREHLLEIPTGHLEEVLPTRDPQTLGKVLPLLQVSVLKTILPRLRASDLKKVLHPLHVSDLKRILPLLQVSVLKDILPKLPEKSLQGVLSFEELRNALTILKPQDSKTVLLGVTPRLLQQSVGESYAKLVVFCLRWIDEHQEALQLTSFTAIRKVCEEFSDKVNKAIGEIYLGTFD